MLNFFRKYQKFFFLFTTIIIVTSFAFFGTYQAFAPSFMRGGGAQEEQSYPDQLAQFLNTENWMMTRKIFEANFLNDGVISKEFLETGMADLVVEKKLNQFQASLSTKLERERQYTPYVHPSIPSLSAESIWSIFVPDLPEKLRALQTEGAGFKERKELFLAQKEFPPPFLSQVLRYQEQNNLQYPSDPRLAKEDLVLFGYRNYADWFGQEFVDTLAQTVIQMANVARKQGYHVSKEELLIELVQRSEETYRGIKDKIKLPVENGYGLFQLYLRQIGMKEATALKIWEDITLFRRLMHEVGSAAMIDPLPLSQFYAYAFENITVELYQMAPEFRLKSEEDLKRFESYLLAVGENPPSSTSIPLEYAPLQTIEQRAPALVGKRYHLFFTEVSKEALQAKVSVKETIEWECDPAHWDELQNKFPELSQKTGSPFQILEEMEAKGRKLVDAYARKQIVESHPEWMEEMVIQADMQEKDLFLSSVTKKPFAGITNIKELEKILDTQDEIVGYTQDHNTYYRFLVRERSEGKEVLTYKAALREKVLDHLVEQTSGIQLIAPPPSRFAEFLAKYKEQPPEGELAKQFTIEKIEKTITRSEPSFISIDEALTLEEGVFSEVGVDPEEGAFVYRFIDRKFDKTFPLQKMMQTQELLSREARYHYFKSVFDQIHA